MRYVVVLSRFDDDYSQVLIGPFRSKERAEERCGVIGRLAAKYDDPEGSIGDENVLDVCVQEILPGPTSADAALCELDS